MKLNSQNKLKARFYAFGIDLFAIAIIQKAVLISYLSFLNDYFFSYSAYANYALKSQLATVELPIMLLSFWSYFFISVYTTHGKTLGKAMMGLEIFSQDDLAPPCLWQSITRATVTTLGYFTIFPLLFPLFNKNRKSFADLISQTTIIFGDEENYQYQQNSLNIKEEGIEFSKSA